LQTNNPCDRFKILNAKNTKQANLKILGATMKHLKLIVLFSTITPLLLIGGCAGTMDTNNIFDSQTFNINRSQIVVHNNIEYKIDAITKSAKTYEDEGIKWGRLHWANGTAKKLDPNSIDMRFVIQLAERKGLDFFWVHSELKEAFRKGYRIGYQDRTADLVLGPNVSAAAVYIGQRVGNRFVKTIEDFETGWANSIMESIDVFITLISEGSQVDRERFIATFTDVYLDKYQKTQKLLKGGASLSKTSEGGTLLQLDYSQGKLMGALDIPPVESLKNQLYDQTFIVMGDELGRRFSNNLIKRQDLVDLLRRSKTALQESPFEITSQERRLERNMKIIHRSFVSQYGTDADNVFKGLIQEAGYSTQLLDGSIPKDPIARPQKR
jgi:hypothetical protein